MKLSIVSSFLYTSILFPSRFQGRNITNCSFVLRDFNWIVWIHRKYRSKSTAIRLCWIFDSKIFSLRLKFIQIGLVPCESQPIHSLLEFVFDKHFQLKKSPGPQTTENPSKWMLTIDSTNAFSNGKERYYWFWASIISILTTKLISLLMLWLVFQ